MSRLLRIFVPLACLLTAGCVAPNARVDNLLSQMTDVEAAKQIFGQPTATYDLGGGVTRYAWQFDRQVQIPGQWVEHQEYVGRDRDGFIVYRTVRIFVPEHTGRSWCSIGIASGPDGKIREYNSQGNDCEMLLTPEGREKVLGKENTAR